MSVSRQDEYPARRTKFRRLRLLAHNARKEHRMKTLLLTALLACVSPVFAADPSPIEKSIASPDRTKDDRERDARDKPAEVMAFAGVKPGMTVADIFSAGGYWTELLSGVVGPTGKVYAVN